MRLALLPAFLFLAATSARAEGAFSDCARCPEMIPLPAGSFQMGRDGGRKAEAPQHQARVETPFAIARTEVTFDQWQLCVEAGGCTETPWDRDWGRADRPVIYVDWAAARDYAAWLSRHTGRHYRLPSETEWEYAAWGGTRSPGERRSGRGRANCNGCNDNWDHRTLPVGSFPANGFGLHDMLGNVMEWTRSCWRETHDAAAEDCSRRIRRGGSWYFNRWVSTPTYRYGGRPQDRNYDIGFRVVSDDLKK